MPCPPRLYARRAFVAGALLAAFAQAAPAQSVGYPSRPVTVVVPFAAGGSVDAAARLVLQKLGERMQQTFVVDNVAGAAGTIGTLKAVRAPADGYTLLFAVSSPINVAPVVQPSIVKYDPFKDLVPVAAVATSPFVLVGSPKLAATNTAGLIELARRHPGKLNYGTDGVGTSMHLTAETLKLRAGIDVLHVPYRSGPQVLTELSAGLLDLAVMPVALVQPFVKDGKVRAYGVTSRQRWASLPEVPALAETAALKDVDVESWYGLFAPAGTDSGVVSRLGKELSGVLADADLAHRMSDAGLKPSLRDAAQFAALLRKERESLGAVVAAAKIKVE